MSYVRGVATLALSALAAHTAHADEGQLKSKLLEGIRAAQKGDCPKTLMSPMLQDACERQMPNMGNQLASKGTVRSAEFRGTQPTPMGPAEVYRVTFESAVMAWMISAGPDGKLVIFWTSGQ